MDAGLYYWAEGNIMAIFTQLPGRLDIKMNAGDDLSMDVDFNQDITGYTFASFINNSTASVFTITR